MQALIEISARHVHLSKEDFKKLFEKDHELKELKKLSQIGEFASLDTVVVSTDKGSLEKVRVVGPLREKTQVEISKTEARLLGINPPLRVSGDVKGSARVTLVGAEGEVELTEGVILAQRHLHLSPAEASQANLKNNDIVSVKIAGGRGVTFHEVAVRVKDNYRQRVHIDTDEANAAGLVGGESGEIIV